MEVNLEHNYPFSTTGRLIWCAKKVLIADALGPFKTAHVECLEDGTTIIGLGRSLEEAAKPMLNVDIQNFKLDGVSSFCEILEAAGKSEVDILRVLNAQSAKVIRKLETALRKRAARIEELETNYRTRS
jgi:hypothetical protein